LNSYVRRGGHSGTGKESGMLNIVLLYNMTNAFWAIGAALYKSLIE